MKLKKIIAIIFLAVFILTSLSGGTYASSINNLKDSQKKVQQEISKYKNIINSTKGQLKSVTSDVKNIDSQINTKEQAIGQMYGQISSMKKNLGSLEEKLASSEMAYREKQASFAKRISFMYQDGKIDFMEVIVDSANMTDFLVRYEMLSRLAENDMKLIKGLNAEKEQLQKQKDALANQQASLVNKKAELSAVQQQLENAKREKQSIQAKLEQEKRAAEAALAEEEKASKEIERKIRAYLASHGSSGKYTGGAFTWPVPGRTSVSSNYGWRIHPVTKKKSMHTGIDIPAPKDSKVVSAADGTVIFAEWFGAYGNAIIIDHGGGLTTLYGHLNSFTAKVGSKVSKGSQVGRVGTTGLSTGYHLHFEVRLNSEPTSPWNYLK